MTFSFLYNAQKIHLKNVQSAEVFLQRLLFVDNAKRDCYTHVGRAGNVPGIVPGNATRSVYGSGFCGFLSLTESNIVNDD